MSRRTRFTKYPSGERRFVVQDRTQNNNALDAIALAQQIVEDGVPDDENERFHPHRMETKRHSHGKGWDIHVVFRRLK